MTNNRGDKPINQSVTHQYQTESSEQVPEALDRLILDMAKNNIEQNTQTNARPKKIAPSGAQWFATAAVMVIGFGLVTFMQQEVPEQFSVAPEEFVREVEEEIKMKKFETDSPLDVITNNDSITLKSSPSPTTIFPSISTNGAMPELETQTRLEEMKTDQISQSRKTIATSPQKQAPMAITHDLQTEMTDTSSAPPTMLMKDSLIKKKSEKESIKRLADRLVIKYNEFVSVRAGDSITHEFEITNKDNNKETYIIDFKSNKGWSNLKNIPKNITLSPRETYVIKVTSVAPKTATEKNKLHLILTIIDHQNHKILQSVKTFTEVISN